MRKHTYFGLLESAATALSLLVFACFFNLIAEDTAAEDFANVLLGFLVLFLVFSVLNALLSQPQQVWNLGPSAVGLLKDSGQTIEIHQGESAGDLAAIKTIRGTYLLGFNAEYIAYPDGSVRKGSMVNGELLVPVELTMARLSDSPVDFKHAPLQPLVGNKIIGLRRVIYCGVGAGLLTLLSLIWDTCWEKYYAWQVEKVPGVQVAFMRIVRATNGRNYLDVTITKGGESLAFERLDLKEDRLGAYIQIGALDGMHLYDSIAFINQADENCLDLSSGYNGRRIQPRLDIGRKGAHHFLVDNENFNPEDLTDLSDNLLRIRKWLQKVPTWPNTYSYVGPYYEGEYFMSYRPRSKILVKHYLFKSRVKRNANL